MLFSATAALRSTGGRVFATRIGLALAIALSGCGPTATVTGTVAVWGESTPLSETEIRVVMTAAPPEGKLNPNVQTVYSDSEGRFVADDLTPGARYRFEVADSDLVGRPVSATLPTHRLTLDLPQPVLGHSQHDLRLHAEHCLNGQILADASLRTLGNNVTSDLSGVATLKHIGRPGTERTFKASAQGFIAGEASFIVPEGPPWTPTFAVELCPANLPAKAALVYADEAGAVQLLQAASLQPNGEMVRAMYRYHFKFTAPIPLVEAQAAPKIGSRGRLLIDEKLLKKRGSMLPGALQARLLMSEPDGTVPDERDWTRDDVHTVPTDKKIPVPGAYVGMTFAHSRSYVASYAIDSDWVYLTDHVVEGINTPLGWKLIQLAGEGPWGILTRRAPAKNQVFLAAP